MLATLFLVLILKDAGIGDRFIQQSEADQERAFQKLFTIDLLLGAAALALGAIALPIFALAYGQPEIIVPGLVLSLAILGSSLQSPNIIYYRQMDFVRARIVGAIDPCTAFVVTVGLAIAGAGYWSLVIGAVVGSFAGATVALSMCPYRLGFHLPKGTVGDYFSFSWPLVLARGGVIAVGQATLLIATRTLGLAAAGAIALAASINQFSRGVDNIVTQTLYPGICAVRERRDLLFEAFVKSNRLSIMWGMPFGFGLVLFAPDLVYFVLGARWEEAIPVLQAFGAIAAFDQLGFNWAAFIRALGDTKPIAVLGLLHVASFVVITTPLFLVFGLPGFAAGSLIAEAANLTGRMYFLRKLFPGFRMGRHALRAIAPSVPAIAVVLLVRLAEQGPREPLQAAIELALYGAVTIAGTAVFERPLVRELAGYLRREADSAAGEGAAHATSR
jgi:PST family polysaccharide transporter